MRGSLMKKSSGAIGSHKSHDVGVRAGRLYYDTKLWVKKERCSLSEWVKDKRRKGEGHKEAESKDRFYPRDFRGPFGPYGW